MTRKEEIEKEIAKLKELGAAWINYDASPLELIDLVSDIEYFRENTHIDFQNVNSFYFSDAEYADTFFEDAASEIWTYIESNLEYKQALQNAMENLHNGFEYLLEKLNQMKLLPS